MSRLTELATLAMMPDSQSINGMASTSSIGTRHSSESILRCVRAVFKKRSAHAIDIRTEHLQSSHVYLARLITDVSLLRLHAQQRDTHHHQHGLHTKTLCQLPTLTQFKLCCIGVLTFGSLGTGSNPHPVTDRFSQQGSRYCEICLLLLSAHQVTTSLARRATLWELHAMSMDSCTLRLNTSLFSCWHLGTGFHPKLPHTLPSASVFKTLAPTQELDTLSRREPQHLHTLELSLTCAAGLSSHKS